MASSRFKATLCDLGFIKAGSKKNRVEWEFKNMSKEDIAKTSSGEYGVVPGCGCTVDLTIKDDRIVAYYNHGSKIGTVTKGMTVYFKPSVDIPLKAKNAKGIFRWNNNLEKITLYFKATTK